MYQGFNEQQSEGNFPSADYYDDNIGNNLDYEQIDKRGPFDPRQRQDYNRTHDNRSRDLAYRRSDSYFRDESQRDDMPHGRYDEESYGPVQKDYFQDFGDGYPEKSGSEYQVNYTAEGKYNSSIFHDNKGTKNEAFDYALDSDLYNQDLSMSEENKIKGIPLQDMESEVFLDDGNKTYIFRKKRNPKDDIIHQHRISQRRHSTARRKSVISAHGYVPSHRDDVFTLSDKIKMLHKQSSLQGVVDVFREKILHDSEEQLTGFSKWKYRQKKNWSAFKQHVQNILGILELWSGSFKTIEGRFGTAIMNYFRFIRWLMFMNLYMVVIIICAVFVPQLILDNSPFNQTSAIECSEEYNYYIENITNQEHIGNQILDVLQGTGWMEKTVLFYGVYQNKTVLNGHANYNMSLSYLLAIGFCFLISFFLIIRNTGKGLKEGVMNKDSAVNQYFNKVFCGGWDYCISVKKAAKRRHKNIFREIKGDLEAQRHMWKKQSRTTKDKIRLFTVRTVLNVFVLAVLAGSLYLIFYTNYKMLELQDSDFTELNAIVQALIQYLPSITITVLNVIVPVIFIKLVVLEDFTPVFEIRITLLRIILLRLASLGILIGSLYRVITTSDQTVNHCGNSRWDVLQSNVTNVQFSRTSIKCWETYVGQQIYKLIIMDFLVGVITTFLVEFPRRIIYKRFHKSYKLIQMVGQQEFDLPKNVLDIVYSQTLCWMGMFFCPLTPLIGLLKCFIFFYVKKVSLLQNCIQPVRPYRTSRSNSLFAAVLFLSILLAGIPLTYLIGSFHPSQSCGPFRQYEGHTIFFNTITNLIDTWPSTAVKVFRVIGSTAFLVPAILLVCSMMYGYWAAKEGSKREAELLQQELTEEGRDKQFLVAQLNEILQHLDATNS